MEKVGHINPFSSWDNYEDLNGERKFVQSFFEIAVGFVNSRWVLIEDLNIDNPFPLKVTFSLEKIVKFNPNFSILFPLGKKSSNLITFESEMYIRESGVENPVESYKF